MKTFTLLCVLLGWCAAARAEPLAVGSPAPALRPSRWLKGDPVNEFVRGHVYVVEFWATWCGPCKANIPHLTELARKHAGKVTVIGVNVWERPAGDRKPDALVDAFLAQIGPQMGYTVAQDDAQGTIARDWLTAAYQGGIPVSMVVDQDGVIAWIGHPAKGLEAAVEATLAGGRDMAAARADYLAGLNRTLFTLPPYAAPALEGIEWLRGTPVERFEPGKLYVVSVWSAGDAASESAYPRLAELRRRYEGRVVFLGVQIGWARRNPGAGEVRDYLKQHPELDFSLATDSPEKPFRMAWMAPRKIASLPSVFIVDGEGKVVWSGHPMVEQFGWALERLTMRRP